MIGRNNRRIRVIISDKPIGVIRLHALEEAILKSTARTDGDDVLLVHNYKGLNCVSIGWKQAPNDIDMQHCRSNGYELTRRITDGWAILHDEGMIGYSWIGRSNAPDRIWYNVLWEMCTAVTKGLRRVGITAEYDGESRIFANGKRIAANAPLHPMAKKHLLKDLQGTRLSLAHGLLLFDKINGEGHLCAFHTEPDKLNNMTTVTSLNPETTREEIVSAIILEISNGTETSISHFNPEELKEADNIEKRYASQSWFEKRDDIGTLEGTRASDCFVDTKHGLIRSKLNRPAESSRDPPISL